MLFWTAGFQPAHDHDAGWKPAVRKTMTHMDSGLIASQTAAQIATQDERGVPDL
jgi:hypothetical protein